LSQALTFFSRALRCHRRLAKLAPSFFDPVVVHRGARVRDDRMRWGAEWERALEKVYGPSTDSGKRLDDPEFALPPLPDPPARMAIQLECAALDFYLVAGRAALDRHQKRHPNDMPSLKLCARLVKMASDLGRMACGLDNRAPEPPAPSPYPHVRGVSGPDLRLEGRHR
jgi:hypothetical protein